MKLKSSAERLNEKRKNILKNFFLLLSQKSISIKLGDWPPFLETKAFLLKNQRFVFLQETWRGKSKKYNVVIKTDRI